MDVLVDYNNIDDQDRRRGAVYVVDRILAAIGPVRLRNHPRVTIRLYDGWYEQQRLTRYAQSISADVQAAFPLTRSFTDTSGRFSILVNAELAYSLHSDPTFHLWHTFRRRNNQRNFDFCHPSSVGCANSPCPLVSTHSFFSRQACPEPSCSLCPSDMLVRNEQKLVDAMMVSDLLSLHLSGAREAVLVTSDDDLWPAIRMATKYGLALLHVHTRTPHPNIRYYTTGLASQYSHAIL